MNVGHSGTHDGDRVVDNKLQYCIDDEHPWGEAVISMTLKCAAIHQRIQLHIIPPKNHGVIGCLFQDS